MKNIHTLKFKKRYAIVKSVTVLMAATVFGANLYASEASDDLLKRINDKGTITVGTEGTYAPFTYHNKSGTLTGYDVEVTRAVADKLGVTVDFKETQWDAMLSGLNSQRFDLVANQVGLTSPERQAKYDSTTPYSYSGAVVVARGDDTRLSHWSSLSGLTSAQSLTSNYGQLAESHGAAVVGVDGLAQALQLVLQKRVDVTINDNLAVLDFLQKQPAAELAIVLRSDEKVPAGFVFNKGNEATIELFNKALEELRADGTLQRLGEQFFGENISVK